MQSFNVHVSASVEPARLNGILTCGLLVSYNYKWHVCVYGDPSDSEVFATCHYVSRRHFRHQDVVSDNFTTFPCGGLFVTLLYGR